MIQVLALLVAGLAAVAIWLAEGFGLLVACWVLGAVLHAGLVSASTGSVKVRDVAREVFLAELVGAWVLVMGGLNLVLSTGASSITDAGAVAPAGHDLDWAGLGLLLVVIVRLGLPPIGPWPARLAASPPVVRVFLHAGLHPLTALMLWWRLETWLLPWHGVLALWLGAASALAAAVAAAGERQLPRRAALLSCAAWGGLLALGAQVGQRPWSALVAVIIASMLVHLVAAGPRWPRVLRRWLLAVVAAAPVAAALQVATAAPDLGASMLAARIVVGLASIVALLVLGHWWRTLAPAHEANATPRGAFLPAAERLARLSRQPGPLPSLVAVGSQQLARLVATVDRIVLDGVVEGLAVISLGAGWLVAWCDRRAMDGIEFGVTRLVAATGRWSRDLAAGRPSRLVFWLGLAALGLMLLGRAA